MKTVYISCPITGYERNVYETWLKIAEDMVEKQGHKAINPIKIADETMSYGECIGITMTRLIDEADMVYFLRGWEKSKGCMLEFEAAKIYNKEIWFE